MNSAILNPQSAIQRPLPLTGVAIHLPCVDYNGARAMLGVDEREIAGMVDEGVIEWAWDIASKSASRPEMRFLVASVKAAQDGRRSDLAEADVHKLLWGQRAADLRVAPPFIWGVQFTRTFNCVPNHTINLCLEGTLKRVADTAWRPGPGGSPCIAWESIIEFVRSRRRPQ